MAHSEDEFPYHPDFASDSSWPSDDDRPPTPRDPRPPTPRDPPPKPAPIPSSDSEEDRPKITIVRAQIHRDAGTFIEAPPPKKRRKRPQQQEEEIQIVPEPENDGALGHGRLGALRRLVWENSIPPNADEPLPEERFPAQGLREDHIDWWPVLRTATQQPENPPQIQNLAIPKDQGRRRPRRRRRNKKPKTPGPIQRDPRNRHRPQTARPMDLPLVPWYQEWRRLQKNFVATIARKLPFRKLEVRTPGPPPCRNSCPFNPFDATEKYDPKNNYRVTFSAKK